MFKRTFILGTILLSACSQETPVNSEPAVQAVTPEPQPPNFLILVADDLGVTSMPDWGINERSASTATISQLAAEGMRFEQFWSQPVCSPMRVSTLTGRYSFRHGIGGPLWGMDTQLGLPPAEDLEGAIPSLDFSPMGRGGPLQEGQMSAPTGNGPLGPDPDELFLPAVLKSLNKGYATAAFGKWHMASHNNGGANHPNLVGFDHYSGPIEGALESFASWIHVENGKARHEHGYVDQKSTDDATAWISQQQSPWMVWFSFINPHEPFHKPPVNLIQTEALKQLDPLGMTNDNTTEYFRAMIEAMDSLSGQIIASIPEDQIDNTYIIWLGDNGDEHNAHPPADRLPNKWKTTNYQGGAHVPFVIRGPGIQAGAVNSSLAHVVDIFGTVVELAGGHLEGIDDRVIDSVPLTDQILGKDNPRVREWNYTDVAIFARMQTIRDEQYKLMRNPRGDEFYDLIADPGETTNLAGSENIEIQQAYAALSAQLEALLATEPAEESPTQ